MNDAQRRDWVYNDEGLYDWWCRSGMSITRFVRKNRAKIDAAINLVLTGDKPAYYLKYGSNR